MISDLIISNIDRRLTEKNIKRSKMLQDCCLPESSLRQWKRGSIPLATTLFKIAKYLDVTVEYLLTGIEETAEAVAEPVPTYKIEELSEDTKKLIADFDKLNARDRNLIMTMCHSLANSEV